MKFLRGVVWCSVLACASTAAFGTPASDPADKPPTTSDTPATYSSSVAPDMPMAPSAMMGNMQARPAGDSWTSGRPFSAVGVAVKVGIGGIGFDVAVPLARHLNLRGGAQFFDYSLSTNSDGIDFDGTLNEKSGDVMVDYYPFHGTFRLSPGIIIYNGVNVTANANVPGGQTFTLDDTTYSSLAADPVHGTASIKFGNKVAPAFTLGWGNMIPRHGGHWSVPFEIGFEYNDVPTFTLDLAGTACEAGQGCGSVQTDPDIQENLKEERKEIADDLSPLRFYPIVSIGVSYKFGK